MAYDVTSQWDDIHRKLGNYEPLPVVKKEHEFTKEYIEKLEEICDEEKDEVDLEDSDEEALNEYKRHLFEMGQMKQQKMSFQIKEIDAKDYVLEVNQAGEDICVLLNFFQPYNEYTLHINNLFEEMQKQYKTVKFLKTQATKCVENFPDHNLPYIL